MIFVLAESEYFIDPGWKCGPFIVPKLNVFKLRYMMTFRGHQQNTLTAPGHKTLHHVMHLGLSFPSEQQLNHDNISISKASTKGYDLRLLNNRCKCIYVNDL